MRLLDNMGYDVEILREKGAPKYHRWFSIWNWHRLMVSVLYGMGALNDEQVEGQLMTVTSLQNGQYESEGEDTVEMLIKKSDNQTSGKNLKRILIIHDIEYDVKGRGIGCVVRVPEEVVESFTDKKDFDKFMHSMEATSHMQMMTNHLLFDYQEETGLGNKTCQNLSSMSGKPIDADTCKMLATGIQLALARFGILGGDFLDGMSEVVDAPDIISDMRGAFAFVAKEHASTLELDELWDPKDMGCIGPFVGLFTQAAFDESSVKIT